MKARNIIIAILVLALMVVSLAFHFYAQSQRKALREQWEFYIAVHDALYRSAEMGDTRSVEKIQNVLGSILWGETREYRLRFGEVTGSNTFARHFASAESIAGQVQMLPLSSLTNKLGTNVAVRPEAVP